MIEDPMDGIKSFNLGLLVEAPKTQVSHPNIPVTAEIKAKRINIGCRGRLILKRLGLQSSVGERQGSASPSD